MNYYSWTFDSSLRKSVWDYFKKTSLTDEQAKGCLSKEHAMIVDMSPDTYIELAEPINKNDSKWHTNLCKKVDSGEIRKFDTIPALLMRIMEDGHDAKVYGHDGRHRALLMKEKGFAKIPVALYWENASWDELPEDNKGKRFYPKYLWCQNDKNVQREKNKIPFPVSVDDWGRPYDISAEMPYTYDDNEVKCCKDIPTTANDSIPFDWKTPYFCAKARNNFTNNGNRPFKFPFTSYVDFLKKNNR